MPARFPKIWSGSKWISHEHFSVDGTLIESWASMKSFRPNDEEAPPPGKGRNGWEDFKDQKRSNDTHASTTDPESKLVRKSKGKEAKLSFRGHPVQPRKRGNASVYAWKNLLVG